MGAVTEQELTDHSFELAAYQEARADVEGELKKISALVHRFGSETARDLVESGHRDLCDELFRIVVVGEFSRGKSTFINAMLGNRVLPAAPYPVTTVLTCIRDGKEHTVSLVYRDGVTEPITPSRFASLVAPPEPIAGDARSRQDYEIALAELETIERVDLRYPSALCRNGVEIVDTPGTNDINVVREQITYEFIPRADAIIFLLNALEAVTASEIVFLRDRVLKSDVQRVFFAVNFADRLSADDSTRVMARVRRELDKIVRDARVFLVSSKQALKARTDKGAGNGNLAMGGLPQFEAALASFLQQERTSVKLRKPAWRGIRACRELREHVIALSSAALDMDAEQLRDKLRQVQPRIAQYQRLRDERIASFRVEMSASLPQMQKLLRESLYEIAALAESAVLKYPGTFIRDRIMQAVEEATAAKETALQVHLSEMRKNAATSAYLRVADALELERQSIEKVVIATLAPTSKDSAAPIDLCEAALSPVRTALPKGLVQHVAGGLAKVIRLFSPKIARAVEAFVEGVDNRYNQRTIARDIRRVYENRVTPAVIDFEMLWEQVTSDLSKDLVRQADTRIHDLKRQLNQLLDEASSQEVQRASKRQELHAISQQLAEIENELRKLGGWSGTGTATA